MTITSSEENGANTFIFRNLEKIPGVSFGEKKSCKMQKSLTFYTFQSITIYIKINSKENTVKRKK